VASFWALDRDKTGEPQAILEVNNEITELKRAEEAQLRLAAIVESSDDAMMIAKTLDGVITSWNSGAERMYGYGAQEVIGRPISILSPPGHDEEMPATLERIRRGENIEHFETKRRRKDGTLIDVSLTVSSIKSQTGEITGASIVARDVTDRNRLEEQFRQAQKLESIGVLAGGIAHDFNNLLLAILGNASLALDDRTLPHTVRHELQEVVLASERAAELVRQLLVYAGKGVFAIKPVNLGKVVHEITHLIQSSIPKKIDLRFDLASDVPPVAADSGQIQQLVMNLIINAAEAIGENTGTVLVAVGAREIDQSYLRDVFGAGEIMPGWHVVLGVRDTGCGMNDRTKSRIFDPFFTTKFTGRGLGLAAALGIVRRHQGAIKVHSTPHRGTTFEVLLPVMEGRPAPSESAALPGKPSGNGAILVVDDETLVGRTAKAALEHHGYEVILAKSGHEGIELFESRASEIAVVLLDMNMPMMGGETAFEQLKKIRPDVRVIVTSGYNEERAVERFGGKRVAGFIQKPYTPRQLAEKVKRVLEAGEGA
jgi:PAS domain S-box-containing protein